MPRYDQSSASCQVFSFKEGLLSPIAHDLRIAVGTFWIEVEGDSVRAEFDANSLVVETAVKDGVAQDSLKDGDKTKIQKQIRADILHTKKHPVITFSSTSFGDGKIEGQLVLHGVTKKVSASTKVEGDSVVSEFTLHQPDYGIKPFRAALGALKVAPDVKIRVSVPDGG